MELKTESVWPLQFEVIEEIKQVGRWSAPSWHIGDVRLYEKVAVATQSNGMLFERELEIFLDERTDYRFNLSSQSPKLFFAFENDNDVLTPVMITASQSMIGQYMDGDYVVLSIDMPLPMQAWLEAFIGKHGELIEIRRKNVKVRGAQVSNFLSRWSLRKRKVQQGEEVSDEQSVEIIADTNLVENDDAVENRAENASSESLIETADSAEEQVSLPTKDDLVSINGTSNVSQFMATGVDKDLKKAALRKMFLNPEFAMEDEPNYSTPAKLNSDVAATLRGWMVEPVEEEEDDIEPEISAETEQDNDIESNVTNENDNEYQCVIDNKEQDSETKKTT
ncbi:DUF3305 domain-containing protein [Aliivibrio salmonicida]|uniref:DUF3305 domain-containing protein n=1 Tax=Aliivibrio salmonicida (strain LFI1238) TaxID=316275 RepID=B6EKW1_ALISL|nr:DUF3305 domain-containing protein [Aliivibrio salmonicida]AZL84733.1 DUF3305 domain-containing protein [Aliivibrio salmonicida]CAQ79134.1 hypothetical protein VSAL_I1449 [Aliivibrio salmonicida LFI1238]